MYIYTYVCMRTLIYNMAKNGIKIVDLMYVFVCVKVVKEVFTSKQLNVLIKLLAYLIIY